MRGPALLGCCLVLALPAAATAAPAPRLGDPAATGRALVIRYFVLLHRKDRADLQTFLSPAFQVQRADGSASEKAAFLANLPTVGRFYLSNLTATEAGGTLVVRYLARVEGLVNGKPYTPGPAPRLSVFTWNGERWQLAAHANFNPLTG
jgi:hypothetical protein